MDTGFVPVHVADVHFHARPPRQGAALHGLSVFALSPLCDSIRQSLYPRINSLDKYSCPNNLWSPFPGPLSVGKQMDPGCTIVLVSPARLHSSGGYKRYERLAFVQAHQNRSLPIDPTRLVVYNQPWKIPNDAKISKR